MNDKIVTTRLVSKTDFDKVNCYSEITDDINMVMIRQHMLRGYNEKVFFAVTHNKVDKIMMINYQSNK